ncbi:TPA: hypothetical protein ACH3X1_009909 [Trebouxia sp. C0004]
MQGIVMGAAQMLTQGFNDFTSLQDRNTAPAKRHGLPNRPQTSSYGARKVLSTIPNRKSIIKIVKQDCVEKRPKRERERDYNAKQQSRDSEAANRRIRGLKNTGGPQLAGLHDPGGHHPAVQGHGRPIFFRILWWRILHGCVMCGAFSAYIGRATPQQACCPFACCCTPAQPQTISHMFLECPVAATVVSWLCRLWQAMTGYMPVASVATILAASTPDGQCSTDALFQTWHRLRPAVLHSIWTAARITASSPMFETDMAPTRRWGPTVSTAYVAGTFRADETPQLLRGVRWPPLG